MISLLNGFGFTSLTNDGVVAALIGHHGPPAIALTGVFACVSSTDHVGGDVRGRVGRVRGSALGISHRVHINLKNLLKMISLHHHKPSVGCLADCPRMRVCPSR